MDVYQSHKKVRACFMARGDYNELRGWRVPVDENPEDEGYLVEYLDSPSDKMPEPFENYISWSPKTQFNEGYTNVNQGQRVQAEQIESLLASLTYVYGRVGTSTVTTCHAFLPAGFCVGYGQSACIDPALYSQEIGERIAKENCELDAKNKLWQFEEYKLATQ